MSDQEKSGCITCQGTGMIDDTIGRYEEGETECPDCDGLGYYESARKSELSQLRSLCREQHEALKLAHENRNRIMPIATDIEIISAIEKYTKVMGHDK